MNKKELNKEQIFIVATLIAEGIQCIKKSFEMIDPEYEYYSSRKDFYGSLGDKIQNLLKEEVIDDDVETIFESINRQTPRLYELVINKCRETIIKVDTEEVTKEIEKRL